MTTEIERELRRLRQQHGQAWQFWTVYQAVSLPRVVWCARLHKNHRHVLNAYSAEELEQHIKLINDVNGEKS
jgi:hypothetical protein